MLFRYEAISYNAEKEAGQIEAPDLQKAVEKLRAKGRVVIKLTEVRVYSLKNVRLLQRKKKLKAQELALFCRQLGAMYSAGITLLEALKTIKENASPGLKVALTYVVEKLQEGQSLSGSFGPEWPFLFRQSLIVAEETGNIESTLMRLAKHYEGEARLRGRVLGAMTYPGIVLLVSVTAVIFLLVFVFPQFLNLFQALNLKPEDLPGTTRAIMALSYFISTKWPLLFSVLGLLGLALYWGLKSRPGIIVYDALIRRLPVIGWMRELLFALSFARNLEAMYSAGVPIVQALDINRKLIGNYRWAQALEKIIAGLRRGLTISEQIQKEKVFPAMLTKLLSAGEQTGRFSEMLDRAAVFFEEEISLSANKLTSWIEPLLLVVLGGTTAFVLLAVITPIFKAAESIGGIK